MLKMNVMPNFDHIVPAMHDNMDRFFGMDPFTWLKYEVEREMCE